MQIINFDNNTIEQIVKLGFNRIFNVGNICFGWFNANAMIGRINYVPVSFGSTCSSVTFVHCHVLSITGLNYDDAFYSIRFSLGRFIRANEIQNIIEKIRSFITKPL